VIEAIKKLSSSSVASTGSANVGDVTITVTRKKSSTDTVRKASEARLLR
jgi:hypothetical protein